MKFLAILSILATASAQIIWNGNPYALSSISTTGETQLTDSSSGAQFLYTKQGSTAPLVTVKLENTQTGASVVLQENFDMISQSCSCYYIDSKEVKAKFGGVIVSSRAYRLSFDSATFKAASGFFAIRVAGDTSDLPAPIGGITTANSTTSTSTSTQKPTQTPTNNNNSDSSNDASKKMVISAAGLAVLSVMLI